MDTLTTQTILKMFTEKAAGLSPENSATELDLAYLKARYSGAPAQTATQEAKKIAILISQNLSQRSKQGQPNVPVTQN